MLLRLTQCNAVPTYKQQMILLNLCKTDCWLTNSPEFWTIPEIIKLNNIHYLIQLEMLGQWDTEHFIMLFTYENGQHKNPLAKSLHYKKWKNTKCFLYSKTLAIRIYINNSTSVFPIISSLEKEWSKYEHIKFVYNLQITFQFEIHSKGLKLAHWKGRHTGSSIA